jgi:hypothetical protein
LAPKRRSGNRKVYFLVFPLQSGEPPPVCVPIPREEVAYLLGAGIFCMYNLPLSYCGK